MRSIARSWTRGLHGAPGTRTLLVGAFTSSLGAYLLVPYLAGYLVNSIHVQPSVAATIIGANYWILRASGFLLGPLLRFLRIHRLLFLATLLRAIGYLPLLTGNFSLILIGLGLVSVGGGLYFPASKVYLNQLVRREAQLTVVATRNTFANSGAAAGPVLGFVLYMLGVPILALSASLFFSVLSVFVARLPVIRPASGDTIERDSSAGRLAPFVLVAAMSGTVGALLIQPEATLPIWAQQVHLVLLLPVFFALNAILVALLQPIGLRLYRRIPASLRFSLGTLSAAVGFSLIGVTGTLAIVFWTVACLILTVGEILLSLSIDDFVRHYPIRTQASLYGAGGIADASGGLLGSVAGGLLLQAAGSGSGPLVFAPFVYGAVAVAVLVQFSIRRTNQNGVLGEP